MKTDLMSNVLSSYRASLASFIFRPSRVSPAIETQLLKREKLMFCEKGFKFIFGPVKIREIALKPPSSYTTNTLSGCSLIMICDSATCSVCLLH